MKIGKFAEANGLSIDTIRHYMDMGLIIPEKKGGQYYFDLRCQEDLYNILNLKSMGFTLSEIKTIFMFKGFGKLTPFQEDEYYRALYKNKYSSIEKEIEELNRIRDRLKDKLQELSKYKFEKNFEMGIGIKALSLFSCLKCGGELILSHGKIINNQVMNGSLRCSCGEEYIIRDGILMVGSIEGLLEFKFDYNYIRDYISLTDISYLENLYKGLEWEYRRINFDDFKSKVLLELGSGMGFFLRSIYNDLPDDCVYIAVDYNLERHQFLKNMLEGSSIRKNIIFVCSDFLKIPIRNKSIDVLLDISGTSNYSFDNEAFLLKEIDNYVRDDAMLIGAYILFKNFGANSQIDEKYRKNFILKNIKEEIKALKYKLIDEKTSGYIEKGGKYESFFNQGEKIYSYIFYGKR